jgi:hypothetical protein
MFEIFINSVRSLSFSLTPDKRVKYVCDLSLSSVVVIDSGCILCAASVDAEERVSRRSSRHKNEAKSKVQLEQSMKALRGSGSLALIFH